MSRLVTNGFEMQSLSTTTSVAEGEGFSVFGSPVVETSTVRSGSASLKAVSGSVNHAVWGVSAVLGRSYWVRVYMRVASYPSAVTHFIQFNTAAGATVGGLRMRVTGDLRPFNQAGANIGTLSSPLSTGTWHKIDFLIKQNASPASNNGTVAYWIDDVQIGATVTNIDLGTTTIGSLNIGNCTGVTNGNDFFFDDVALNDDQGSAPYNTRPTGGKIILAKPTSDVSRASWTQGDASGTTNLYQAVDNIPPTGKAIANPPAATDQIRNAATGTMTNERYVADLPTRLGLGADDVPKIVQAAATVSIDAVAGGNVGVQCYGNPTDTELTGVGGVSTTNYPSAAWLTIRGTVNYDPTVANSASQVAVRKTVADAAALSCAFLGVYVEYTPVVGLADSVTVTDSISIELGGVKTETVTASDTEVASVGQAQADTVALTDTERADVTTTQADSVTTSDSVSVEPGLVKSDSVTLSDSSSREPGPVVSDSVTPSDSITGKDVTVGRSETLTLSDALTTDEGLVLGDSVTTSDSQAKVVATSQADAVTPADAISSEPGVQISDSVTLSDSQTTESGVARTDAENDSVALSDFLSTHLESAGTGGETPPSSGGGFAGVVRVPVIRPAQHTVGLADVLILSDALRQSSLLDPDFQREEEELLALV